MSVCMPAELLSCMYMSTVAFTRFTVVFRDLCSGVPKFWDLDQTFLCITPYSKRAQGLRLFLNRKCFLGSYNQWALAAKCIWINISWCLNSSFVSSACFLFSHWLSAKVEIKKFSPVFIGCASPITLEILCASLLNCWICFLDKLGQTYVKCMCHYQNWLAFGFPLKALLFHTCIIITCKMIVKWHCKISEWRELVV